MVIARRWLDPGTLERLRQLTVNGNHDASRALRHWDRRRRAPVRSPERRAAQRAFERAAIKALGE